jgi:puromycin-sensitive aminopeptidase
MENWGLVLYREYLVFFDKLNTPQTQKELIGRVATHEIAHMWFGNFSYKIKLF